jgi:hypothetical protein
MGVLNFAGKGVNSLRGEPPIQRPEALSTPDLGDARLTSLNVGLRQLTYLLVTSTNDINGLRHHASIHQQPHELAAHHDSDPLQP